MPPIAYGRLSLALPLLLATVHMAAGEAARRRCVPLDGQQTVEYLGAVPPSLVNEISQDPRIYEAFRNHEEGQHGHIILQGLNTPLAHGTALAQKLVSSATCLPTDGFQIVSVRVLWNNHGTPAQPWHIDYGTSGLNTFGLLVALTPAGLNNTTEYKIFRPEDHADIVLGKMMGGGNVTIKTSDYEHTTHGVELDAYHWAIFQAGSTIHRRGPNTSGQLRVTLNIDFTTVLKTDWVEGDANNCNSTTGHLAGHLADDITVMIHD